MKKKRHRVIDPSKAAAAALGGEVAARGFYSRLPAPEKITCSRCGEERNSVGPAPGDPPPMMRGTVGPEIKVSEELNLKEIMADNDKKGAGTLHPGTGKRVK